MSFNFGAPSPYATPTDERPRPKRQQSRINYPVAPSPYERQTPSSAPAPDSYFPPVQPPQQVPTPQPNMQGHQQPVQYDAGGGLAQQMGQMNLDGSAPTHARKKKDRHAYHQLEQPTQSYGGAPADQQYLSGQPVQARGSSPAPTGWKQSPQPWQSQQPSQQTGQFAPPSGTPISMGGQMMGQQSGGMPGGAQARVNPDQIPSVPLSRDTPAEYYKTHIYPTMEQHLPPPSTTPFVSYDQGSASPKYARLTLNCIPHAHDQMVSTGLPLGLVLQPLAKQTDGEQAIPVLDFGEAGPPRCRRCRAYINPFMVFSNGGNRMTCNLCGHPNEVPPEYFAPTDPTGVRVDRASRPELLLGTCEYLVPKEYWSKEPVPMRYLFLLDVSAEAYSRGFLQGICDGVLAAIYGEEEADTRNGEDEEEKPPRPSKVPPGAKVGFMTFDREIHFYDVSSGVTAPQELVVSDLDDPFAAIAPERLFVDASECRTNVTTLLKRIPDMFANIKYPAPVLLPSLHAALSALESTGGKIICSLATLPTFGPGALTGRDKGQGQNDDSDASREFMKTEHHGYRKCQADMVKAGVGVDFFLAAPMGGYLDIATVGFVAEKTGGEAYYYPNWSYPRDCLRLEKELTHTLRRDQGFAALMKVRCSNGLQVAHYSGNFTQHTFGADLELASITQDSGMSVTFAYDGKVSVRLNPMASIEERRRATHVEVRLGSLQRFEDCTDRLSHSSIRSSTHTSRQHCCIRPFLENGA